ncbi:MAG: hypothetical protein ACREAC_20325, partial [Blastocatellia bacterium]
MSKKHAFWALLVALIFSPAIQAGPLDNYVIGLFPKNVTEFAYADLDQARQLPWFAQFQQQVLPPGVVDFERFLSSAGIDPNTQIKQIAWAIGSNSKEAADSPSSNPEAGKIVAIALGDFSTESAEAAFKSRKLPKFEVDGYTLYSSGVMSGGGSFFVLFIDSNTIAFGQRDLVEQVAHVEAGAAESLLANRRMFPLIDKVNDSGTFWGVLNSAGARQAMQRLAPGISKFPAAGKLLQKLQAFTVSVKSSETTQASFQVVCDSPEDTLIFSQLLQAGLLYRKYEAGQNDPSLAHMLDQASIASNGTQV